MIETYYAGAYWAARQESAAECAQRAIVFFNAIARSDEFFTRWFIPPKSRKQAPRPLDLDISSLQELFTQGQTRNDEGDIIEDLGFRISSDNGMRPGKHQSDHAALSIQCGCYAEPISNLCLLNLPSSGPYREHVLTGPMLGEVLRAMALAWEPDWAVATSHAHREMTTTRSAAGTFVGWAMYFPLRRGPVPPMPEPVRVEPLGNLGTIVTLVRASSTAPRPPPPQN